MEETKFLDLIREIELKLFSREFNTWLKTQNEKDKETCGELRTKISKYRSELETDRLRVIAGKLEELSPSFEEGIKELHVEIEEMKEFVKTMETLGKVIGLVSKIVTQIA